MWLHVDVSGIRNTQSPAACSRSQSQQCLTLVGCKDFEAFYSRFAHAANQRPETKKELLRFAA